MSKLYTLNEIKKICLDLNSEFLSKEYKTQKEKYKFKCPSCEKDFEKTFSAFLRSPRCKECSKKLISKHDWNVIVKEKSNGNLSFVKNFWDKERGRQSVILNCRHHGDFHKRGFDIINSKTELKCPKCKEIELEDKFNINSIKLKIEKIAKGYIIKDFKKVGNYKKILVSCGKHEFKWVDYYAFLKGHRCQECHLESKNSIYKHKDRVKVFKDHGYNIIKIHDKHFTLIDEEGYKYRVLKNCISSTNFNFQKFGHRNPHTIENINVWIKINRPDYELVSKKYKKASEKMTFKYLGDFFDKPEELRCFKMSWNSFMGMNRNPHLNIPYGEEIVYKYFRENNISFDYQKWFSDCRNPKTNYVLYFDFITKDKNGNYNYNIEVDGLQHDNIIDYWGGEEGFLDRQYKDSLKNEYMKSIGVQVIRIKKKDFKRAKNILDNIFKQEENNETIKR